MKYCQIPNTTHRNSRCGNPATGYYIREDGIKMLCCDHCIENKLKFANKAIVILPMTDKMHERSYREYYIPTPRIWGAYTEVKYCYGHKLYHPVGDFRIRKNRYDEFALSGSCRAHENERQRRNRKLRKQKREKPINYDKNIIDQMLRRIW